MAAWRPASVVIGSAVKNAAITAVSASIPNHFGKTATFANVSRGEVRTPMKRAGRPIGDGAGAAAVGGVVIIELCLESGKPTCPDCSGTADCTMPIYDGHPGNVSSGRVRTLTRTDS